MKLKNIIETFEVMFTENDLQCIDKLDSKLNYRLKIIDNHSDFIKVCSDRDIINKAEIDDEEITTTATYYRTIPVNVYNAVKTGKTILTFKNGKRNYYEEKVMKYNKDELPQASVVLVEKITKEYGKIIGGIDRTIYIYFK